MFISFSIAMMILANSIFDGTATGIKSSFISSFTGDIVIRPKVDYPLSLFGDETPATGDFSDIPNIQKYTEVKEFIESMPEISCTASQISHPVVLNFNGEHTTTIFFGVNFENYLSVMDGIRIIDSIPYSDVNKENCIMMSKNFIDFLEKDVYAKVKLGDMIQVVVKTPMSYNIRSAKLVAIYEYKSENSVLDKISLVNSELLLDLMGKADSSAPIEEIGSEYQNLLDSDIDLDSLFCDSDGVPETFSEPEVVSEPELPEKAEVVAASDDDDDEYWHYIICRVKDESVKLTKLIILRLNKYFSDSNIPLEAVNWRTAAGLSAQYLYWIRLVFNIGIFIILVTGFIVVNSTLTISSIDRIRETGTMRAIGASRNFIGGQYLFETMILTFVSGILGCILGALFVKILNMISITFTNSYLILLFGGTKLVTSISLSNIRQCFILVVLLTLWGWYYPVRIALGTSPVKAMQGGS
ncbi:MAG: FtsX-like permease family protein [Treponema sp.]|nr:FtsX-like permease family protein [Treponema sp.]